MTIKEMIRPLISLIGVLGLTVGFFMDKINPEAYIGVMAMAITYWFKSRDEEKNGKSV